MTNSHIIGTVLAIHRYGETSNKHAESLVLSMGLAYVKNDKLALTEAGERMRKNNA